MVNADDPDSKVTLSPTALTGRIDHLDVLRGLAIFGILLVNMMYYAHPIIYYQIIGELPWDSLLDRVTGYAIFFLAEGKFITMLAMLFGIGMVIQMDRAETKGTRFFPLYFRRMTILLLFGAVHAFLIWMADILLAYALMGFAILFLFRKCKPKTLIIWAIIFLLIPVSLGVLMYGLALLAGTDPAIAQEMEQDAEQFIEFFRGLADRSAEIYSTGSFAEIMKIRTIDVGLMFAFGIFWMPLAFALMLFGVAVGKTGIPQKIEEHKTLLIKVIRWGFVLGIIGSTAALIGYINADQVESDYWGIIMYFGVAVGAPALSLFYAAGTIQLYRSGKLQKFFTRLSAVGKMALSNYILQSIIATTIFYSYGFGLYGSIGPAVGILITLAIFTLQLFISPLWLKYFHYGLLEWLWRTCTYMKIQPFRKTNHA